MEKKIKEDMIHILIMNSSARSKYDVLHNKRLQEIYQISL